ncbi:MAG: hypothetical protein R6U95_08825 [Bacteroidales bacterium]
MNNLFTYRLAFLHKFLSFMVVFLFVVGGSVFADEFDTDGTLTVTHNGNDGTSVTYDGVAGVFTVGSQGWDGPTSLIVSHATESIDAVVLEGTAPQWSTYSLGMEDIVLAASGGDAIESLNNGNSSTTIYLYYCSTNNTLYYSGVSFTTPPTGCLTPTITTSETTRKGLFRRW